MTTLCTTSIYKNYDLQTQVHKTTTEKKKTTMKIKNGSTCTETFRMTTRLTQVRTSLDIKKTIQRKTSLLPSQMFFPRNSKDLFCSKKIKSAKRESNQDVTLHK